MGVERVGAGLAACPATVAPADLGGDLGGDGDPVADVGATVFDGGELAGVGWCPVERARPCGRRVGDCGVGGVCPRESLGGAGGSVVEECAGRGLLECDDHAVAVLPGGDDPFAFFAGVRVADAAAGPDRAERREECGAGALSDVGEH